MTQNVRAFLYGIFILAAALIPLVISLIDWIEKSGGR
jgi:hypothetical protein